MHLTDASIQNDLHYLNMFLFLSVRNLPRNQTHDLGVASANALLFELQERITFIQNNFTSRG